MRLPNGYGSIVKVSGRRRKPYRVRKTVGWEIDPQTKKAKQKFINIGYYETKAEAITALANYNENPYDINAAKITFAEVYDKWSSKKFEEISNSNINGYKAGYKLCSGLENMKFADIKLSHLQYIVDKSNKAYPTLKKLKTLLSQLFDYAVQHEIIGKDKHIVEYLNIGKQQKSDKHYRFTNKEIETLWRNAENNEYVQLILMLIYTGVRPGELFELKSENVDMNEKSFRIIKGKTINAARKVPIPDKVLPFFNHWLSKNTEYLITQLNGEKIKFDTNHQQYTETYWYPLLINMGILEYTNDINKKQKHTPDDTRHTFTSMWKDKKLDESMRRKIQGHSGKGIGEIVYTHYEFEELRKEINCL